jgi:heptosyltransferase-1
LNPRRILICRTGAMGDVLHALPAVTALRRAQPQWHIGWVVDPRWASLIADPEQGTGTSSLETGAMVDRVYLAETKLWSRSPLSPATLRSILRLRRSLREDAYEVAVDLQGTLRSAVIARMSGAPLRAGYGDPREPLAAGFYTQRAERQGTHVVEQNAHLLSAACGVALTPAEVKVPHAGWADTWAAELAGDRRICVLAPGAGWGAKCWPAAKFGALAQKLHALGLAVRVNAARAGDPLAAEVVAASRGTAEAVVCDVAGLTALLRRSSLLVGGDSGPMHLAAALAVPLVALFGPTDPARNGPWGHGPRIVLRDPASRTTYQRSSEVEPGLGRITVETVLDAALSLI